MSTLYSAPRKLPPPGARGGSGEASPASPPAGVRGRGEASRRGLEAIIYNNSNTDKLRNLTDNKAGIYQWKHIESGKIYIGSAINLSKRLKNYFSESYLSQDKSMYICNALLHHTHSSFSLTILEYVNISNLSKDQVKKLSLEREQHFLDTLNPEYNILKKAASSLRYKDTEGSLAKLSLVNKGEANPFYGKYHSDETKAIMSEASPLLHRRAPPALLRGKGDASFGS